MSLPDINQAYKKMNMSVTDNEAWRVRRFRALVSSLKITPNMRQPLRLLNSHFTSLAALQIVNYKMRNLCWLPKLPSLRVLLLNNNDLSGDSLQQLVECCPNLLDLCVKNNVFDNVEDFRHLQDLHHLQYLILDFLPVLIIQKDCLAEIARILPGVQVQTARKKITVDDVSFDYMDDDYFFKKKVITVCDFVPGLHFDDDDPVDDNKSDNIKEMAVDPPSMQEDMVDDDDDDSAKKTIIVGDESDLMVDDDLPGIEAMVDDPSGVQAMVDDLPGAQAVVDDPAKKTIVGDESDLKEMVDDLPGIEVMVEDLPEAMVDDLPGVPAVVDDPAKKTIVGDESDLKKMDADLPGIEVMVDDPSGVVDKSPGMQAMVDNDQPKKKSCRIL